MVEPRKIIVFIFVTLLLLYMIRFQYSIRKNQHSKTYTFIILMIGLSLEEVATFLDVLGDYINSPIASSLTKFLFTFGSAIYIIGTILWTRFTKKTITSLELLSFSDPLTGVLNRAGINKTFDSLLNKGSPFCLIVYDLDGTKNVNDTYGHIEGDKFICYTTKVVSDILGSNANIARMGGDEFVILLENFKLSEIEDIINRIKLKVNEKYLDKDAGISLGYSFYPKDGISLEDLIKVADKKMYLNKITRR
jgi:diguanylate cyclase (GGDEF)-like protein